MEKRTVKFKYEDKLIELGVLEKYEANLIKGRKTFNMSGTLDAHIKQINEYANDFDSFICCGFPFYLAEEGEDFWHKVASE